MNILYIAAFTTASFLAQNGDCTSSSGLGGSRKISLIMKALAQQGHRLVLLSSIMTSNSRLAWRKEFHERLDYGRGSATVVYPSAFMLRPLGGFINSLRAASLTRHLLTEFAPDVAIVYNTYLFESLAAKELVRITKIPTILEVEDLPLARHRGWFNIKPRLDQQCWYYMLELSSAFTAVNGPILDQLPNDKPKYLLPGVIDERLVALGQSRLAPFSGSQRTLGYFGGLDREKGVQVLLDLVPRLPPGWRLLITGSGSLAADFELLSKKYPDRLTFLGRISEAQLYEVMCTCDCTVIPLERISGGGKGVFPFKTLEFIVAGTHVIASPLPALPDLDLSFIQRWDGSSVDWLLAELSRAEVRFACERSVRKEAITLILAHYSLSSVSALFSQLMSLVTTGSCIQLQTL